MEKVNRYEFEGEVIEVPVYWDDHLKRYAEDYRDYCEQPGCTLAGRPILLTIEDACPHAEMVDDDPAGIDCGFLPPLPSIPRLSAGGYAITGNGEGKKDAPAGTP